MAEALEAAYQEAAEWLRSLKQAYRDVPLTILRDAQVVDIVDSAAQEISWSSALTNNFLNGVPPQMTTVVARWEQGAWRFRRYEGQEEDGSKGLYPELERFCRGPIDPLEQLAAVRGLA